MELLISHDQPPVKPYAATTKVHVFICQPAFTPFHLMIISRQISSSKVYSNKKMSKNKGSFYTENIQSSEILFVNPHTLQEENIFRN